MRIAKAAFIVFILLSASLTRAQAPGEPDAEGCKDSTLLSRIPGCSIMRCESKEFDSAEVPTTPLDANGDRAKKTLEGETEVTEYVCPTRVSDLQIARNTENALRGAGYTLDLVDTKADEPLVTGHKGGVWVSVAAHGWNEFPAYTLTTVREKGMEQQMSATAEGMAAAIASSGRVAVYGINFDTAKATIKPDSEPVLAEVAKLLKAHAAWKIRVEGHTDNVGAKAANQTLSQQRADSVVAWLVAHGIDKARLSAQGFGDSKPLAANDSDAGRAKNRRVELVKQ